MKRLFGIAVLLLIPVFALAEAAAPAKASVNPQVVLETSMGNILLELDAAKAPKTVENFLAYTDTGFFNDTVFHRVIPGFMVQGGGMTDELVQKPTREAIRNEADNGLKNRKGTIAMARTNAPHSASSQFFINLVDNGFLDFKAASGNGWGYCVFGRVIEGMEVVDKIGKVATGIRGFHRDVPKTPIYIKKAYRKN